MSWCFGCSECDRWGARFGGCTCNGGCSRSGGGWRNTKGCGGGDLYGGRCCAIFYSHGKITVQAINAQLRVAGGGEQEHTTGQEYAILV